MITIAGLPALIEPNTAYVLTITNTLTGGTAALAGMQMTILNSNNQKAGEMTMPTNQAVVTNFGGRQYLEHDPALAYTNNMVVWNVTWTSPIGPTNTMITAYAAGNVADGSNTDNGDVIVTTQAAGMLNGGGMALSVNINSSTNVLCFGGNTGSATATASGGVPPYTYNWSNGGSGPTITNIPAGTYTVTVTDNSSATATDNIVITQPTNLVLQPPTITNVSCNGGNNGSITANPTGGTPPYNYAWSTGGTSATISNLSAGSYTLVVTDDNNCMKTANYMVTQPASITINLVNLSHESCANESDGSITISTTGGVNPLSSIWSNGTVGNVNNGLEPGVYSVTVTDNNSCTKTASYTINAGGTVLVNLINQQNVTCPGGSNGSVQVNATGGVPPFTYNWSNGAMGPMATNLAAGNYLVTVSDANGCETVKLYTIFQPPPILIPIVQAGANNCFGDTNVDLTAQPAGGTAPYTGAWSNGTSGLANLDLGAGSYIITVTDAQGCTASATSVVTQPDALTVLVVTTDETSPGANNGTATANPGGGTPGYTYLWSNGGITPMITGLAPGTYTVTVTDTHGCFTTGVGQVDAFGCALDVMLGQDLIICEGVSTTIIPSVIGASGAVTFLWSTGDTTSTITVSLPGEYCVTLTDGAGCQDADCMIIAQITPPVFNCVVTNESAPGQSDGSITCDSMPGVVSYLWSNGATTPSITGLTPGVYCLTVTDIAGCTYDECFSVQAGSCQLLVTSIITDVLCAGDTTGEIAVNVENATPPLVFNWSNGETTSSIQQVGAGSYAVTITDAAGCIELREYIVAEPPILNAELDTVIDITQAELGTILVSASGGTNPYSFQWTTPGGGIILGEDLLALNEPGTYTLLLTDDHGCTDTLDVLLETDVAVGPDVKLKPLRVYPVPAGYTLYLDLENPATEVIINAIDGRKVKHLKDVSMDKIDVADLQSGWYVLRISDGRNWYISRFIKQ